jgi:BolA protein
VTLHDSIAVKLTEGLQPVHLEVDNESEHHNVPKGSETHFKVLIVSQAFDRVSLVDRHRKVHSLLKDELLAGVHALGLRTLTPQEWVETGEKGFSSPVCAGGAKGT